MDRIIETSTTKRKIIFGIVVFLLLVLIFFLDILSAGSSYQVDRQYLVISEVENRKFEDVIPIRSTVEPIKSVFMDAIEGGQVNAIMIEEGAFVEAGDSIIKLTNTRLQLDVISREAEIFRQISNLQNTGLAIEQNKLQLQSNLIDVDYEIDQATRKLESFKDMKSEQYYSEQAYKDIENALNRWRKRRMVIIEDQQLNKRIRETQLTSLQSNIAHLQKNLIVVRTILDKLEIKAPVSGRLTSLDAKLGQSIVQGQSIGQIDDVSRFRTTAQVSEHYINEVQNGQIADLTLNGKKHTQQITKVYPEVSGGHFKIDLEFVGDMPINIRRGQKISLKLQLSQARDLLVVDNGPFFNDTGGAWVFVLDSELKLAHKRFVELGRRTPSQIEVIKGLNLGDQILTSSYANFPKAESLEIN